MNIGYTPRLDAALIPMLQTAFTKESPDTRITFRSTYSVHQMDLLEKGGLEAGIVVLPCVTDGFCVRRVWRDELSLAVPDNHRLAVEDGIALKDLQEEPFIWMAKSLNPFLYDHLLKCCRGLGLVPNIVREVMTGTEALAWLPADSA